MNLSRSMPLTRSLQADGTGGTDTAARSCHAGREDRHPAPLAARYLVQGAGDE